MAGKNGASAIVDIGRKIGRRKFLSREKERELVCLYQDHGVLDAMQEIVDAHLPLILSRVRYWRTKFPMNEAQTDDAVQNGVIGFMAALDKFDMDKNVRVSTHAQFYVDNQIKQGLYDDSSIIRRPTSGAVKKAVWSTPREAAKVLYKNPDLTAHEVRGILAAKFGMSLDDFNKARASSKAPVSFDAPVTSNDGEARTLADVLPDQAMSPETIVAEQQERDRRHSLLRQAWDGAGLNERERDILSARRLQDDPPTLEVLAKEYGVSRERIRQIENGAMTKLREYVQRTEAREARSHERARMALS